MHSIEKKKCIFHIYKRTKTNKEIYRCIAPQCTHYHRKEFLEDKEALCPKCFTPFILTNQVLKNALPTCFSCSKSPKVREQQLPQTAIDGILNELKKLKEN